MWTTVNQSQAILQQRLVPRVTVLRLADPHNTSISVFKALMNCELVITDNRQQCISALAVLLKPYRQRQAKFLPEPGQAQADSLQFQSKSIQDLINDIEVRLNKEVSVDRLKVSLEQLKYKRQILQKKKNYQFERDRIGLPQVMEESDVEVYLDYVQRWCLNACLIVKDQADLPYLASHLQRRAIAYKFHVRHSDVLKHLVLSGFPADNFRFNQFFYQQTDKQKELQISKQLEMSYCIKVSRSLLSSAVKAIAKVYGAGQKIYVSGQDVNFIGYVQTFVQNQQFSDSSNAGQQKFMWIVIGPYNKNYNRERSQHAKKLAEKVYRLSSEQQKPQSLHQEYYQLKKPSQTVQIDVVQFAVSLMETLDIEQKEVMAIVQEVTGLPRQEVSKQVSAAVQAYKEDHLGLRRSYKGIKKSSLKRAF